MSTQRKEDRGAKLLLRPHIVLPQEKHCLHINGVFVCVCICEERWGVFGALIEMYLLVYITQRDSHRH